MKHEESTIQIACVKWFRLLHPDMGRLLFSVPNGGRRNPVTASIMKAEGVVAGVSDFILLVPRGQYHGMCIEMKTRTGVRRDSQKAWQADVEAQGYRYVVCRSVADFMDDVERYLRNI